MQKILASWQFLISRPGRGRRFAPCLVEAFQTVGVLHIAHIGIVERREMYVGRTLLIGQRYLVGIGIRGEDHIGEPADMAQT